jgi:hypothetical protein
MSLHNLASFAEAAAGSSLIMFNKLAGRLE